MGKLVVGIQAAELDTQALGGLDVELDVGLGAVLDAELDVGLGAVLDAELDVDLGAGLGVVLVVVYLALVLDRDSFDPPVLMNQFENPASLEQLLDFPM